MKIWWLNQKDCQTIGDKLSDDIPSYLKNEYESMLYRSGRGRLWVGKHFKDASVSPWPETPLAKLLGEDYGGIVIDDQDSLLIKDLPGIVTNMKLEKV